MSHTSLDFDAAHQPAGRQQLVVEKLGVIAGFLTGLLVGVGSVAEPMAAAGLPNWVSLPATLATVALFTWGGHRVGTLGAERLRRLSGR